MRLRVTILRVFMVLLLSAAATVPLSAQHYIGVKGGAGGMMGRLRNVYGQTESSMAWGKYTGGVVWKYYSAQPVVGGVGVELEYQQRGYRIYQSPDGFGVPFVVSDTAAYRAITRTVSSVTLPLIWQPHLYFAKRKVRMFVNLGFTLSYNLGSGDEVTVEEYAKNNNGVPSSVVTTPYEFQTARDIRWNYGFLGGFGVGVLVGRAEIFAEGRYYYGMSDVLRNQNKYILDNNEIIRSELDNLFVTVGVCFRLGKGGIKAPPLRRAKAPPSESDFTNIRLPF